MMTRKIIMVMQRWSFKVRIISLALICFFAMTSFARELTKNEKTAIANLKDNVRSGRVDSVAEQVEYPQCRSAFPEYIISTKDEFKNNYDLVFDEQQIETFLSSDWRYHYGLLINDAGFTGHFDDDGVLVLDHIPLSDSEWAHVGDLVQKNRATLHPSVRDFQQPVLLLAAGKYLVRIDAMREGKFRYTCWDKGADQSAKPALVLYDGELFSTPYYTSYTFDNEGYEYYIQEGAIECDFTVSAPDGKTLLSYSDYEGEIEFKFYPAYDYSLSRELYMLSRYSEEAMEETRDSMTE